MSFFSLYIKNIDMDAPEKSFSSLTSAIEFHMQGKYCYFAGRILLIQIWWALLSTTHIILITFVVCLRALKARRTTEGH